MKIKGSQWKRRVSAVLCLLFLLCGTMACEKEQKPLTKIKDLEYTVVEEGNVPEDFLKVINEKKLQPFRMSYQSNGYFYMSEGYGTQKSGGYSIRVKELYQSDGGIVLKTELLGPGKDEAVTQLETHPYIVVKIKDIGQELAEINLVK